MKILHVSDFHSHEAWFHWLIAESPLFDLVCLTGDILNLGDLSSDIDREIETATRRLVAIRTSLALCSGNHDLHYLGGQEYAQWIRRLRRENVWIDGDSFWFCDYRFRCIGWCDPVPWAMRDEIVLMHAPPYGAKTSMVAGGISFGDEAAREICLLNAAAAPRILLGGHVHSALRFYDVIGRTLTLNPGQGFHPEIPSHLILDLNEGTAEHRHATASGVTSRTIKFAP